MRRYSAWLSVSLALAACGDNLPPPDDEVGPTISDRSVTTPEDTAVTFDVGASSPSGNALEVTSTVPAHGTLTTAGQKITYTPAENFHGTDSVSVTVSDGTHASHATMSIVVTAVDDAPVAVDDQFAATEDAPWSMASAVLTANDTDVDGDALTVTAVGAATHGTVALAAGAVTFTPDENYRGPATFEYTVSDGTLSDTGTVTLTVSDANDPPVAVADAFTMAEDGVLELTFADLVGNDTDVDGQTLVVTAVGAASTGTAVIDATTVRYTPPADFHGTATFTYTVSDGAATSTGTVTVTVTPVNDAPLAVAAAVITDEDTGVLVTFAGTDVDGDTLEVTTTGGPAHGTLGALTRVSATSFTATYTPTANYTGSDAITFAVSDGTLTSAAATIALTVGATNDAPLAVAAAVTTAEDTGVLVTFAGTDVDGDTLEVTTTGGPAHGTLGALTRASATSFTATYTPAANYNGSDAIAFTVSDGTLTSAAATIALTVTSANDAPLAVAAAVTTAEDTAVLVTFAGTDLDGDTLTVATTGGPAHGTLGALTRASATSFTATYTPAANYNGSDAITFTVSDGTTTSSAATVTLTVTPVNDAPLAVAAAVTTAEGTAVLVTFAGTDVDGDTLTVATTGGPTHGTLGALTRASATSFTATYTPAANYNGGDALTFTVSDGTLTSAAATVALTVTPVNDAPLAVAAARTTAEDTAVLVTFAGTDADGDTLTVAPGSPAHGSLGALTRASATSFTATYTPAANYNGSDAIAFTVSDGTVTSAAATIALTVTAVNDAPLAVAASVTTNEDAAVLLTFAGTDVDGDTLTVATGSPAHGTLGALTRASATSFTASYTPAANYNGSDAITFTVSDGTATSAAASIAITITPVADRPSAAPASVTLNQNTSSTVTLEGTNLDGGALSFAIASAPAHGSLGAISTVDADTATVLYTPTTGYSGSDSFTYTVANTLTSAPATVSVTVTAVNQRPVANAGTSSGNEDSAVTTLVSGSDPDGSSVVLTFTVVTAPTHGTLGTFSRLGPQIGTFSYTPAANYFGPDSYTFKVNDGSLDSSTTATNTITVNAVNDAPTATPVSVTTAQNTAVAITLAGTDIDSATLTAAIDAGPARGTLSALTRTSATSFTTTFTPMTGYSGSDSFTFHMTDGSASSTVVTASISITAASTAVCGDHVVDSGEACDDGNGVETDGCTTQCVAGVVCAATNPKLAAGDHFTTDPATGHCYAAFDDEQTSRASAESSCVTAGGHLASITSSNEQALVASVQNPAQNPWIGATDLAVENTFVWPDGSAMGYSNWEPGQPTDSDGNEDCVQLLSSQQTASEVAGTWNDNDCNSTDVFGRVCELAVTPPPARVSHHVDTDEEWDDNDSAARASETKVFSE